MNSGEPSTGLFKWIERARQTAVDPLDYLENDSKTTRQCKSTRKAPMKTNGSITR